MRLDEGEFVVLPYTYLIGWTNLDTWYYGVRYSANCHPSDLWVKYKTSSKYVERFVCEHGNPDVIQVRKTFKTKDAALAWEETVLRRLNVVNDPRFLNRWDNNMVPINLSGPFPFEDPHVQIKADHTLKTKYGSRGMGIPAVKEKVFAINQTLYGTHHTLNLPHTQKAREEACLAKFGIANPFQSPEFQAALDRKAMAKKASVTLKNLFEDKDWTERNNKSKKTNLEKYGVVNPMNTPEKIAARKNKLLESHGVDNYSKTDEFKQKIASLKQPCPYGCNNGHAYDPGNFSKHMTKEHNWSKQDVKARKNKKDPTG